MVKPTTIRAHPPHFARVRRVLRWSRLILVLLVLGVATVLALFGGAWYYSGQLNDGALAVKHDPDEFDLQVVAVETNEVTLRATDDAEHDGDWSREGLFGIEWAGGYGQAGDIVRIDGREVVREFTPVTSRPHPGDLARLDSFAFPGDPYRAHGIPFEDATYTSPFGQFPAWFVEGAGETWAVVVHGKGADRREALRMLPVLVDSGLPSLVITYRNDEGAPAGADGRYGYGETEWEDLEGAVRFALERGARDVLLVGYSMGGAIVMRFLTESTLAGSVSGVVLDAPVLNFEATVDWGARDRFAPWPVIPLGKQFAAWRFGVDWDELDYLPRADRLSVPILLFHGDDDPKVLVDTSDALARARPDLVTYLRVRDAGHVRAWNSDPQGYEDSLRSFLLTAFH